MYIYDKEYDYVKVGDHHEFLIDGKDGSENRDHSYYKYYALDKYSVDALTHLYVYATHPCQFNDPFDCAEGLIKFDDMDCVRILWEHYYSQLTELFKNDRELVESYSNMVYRTFLYIKMGVLCLSRRYDDLPLWSAYSSHKGFCVEFDVSHFPFKMIGPFPINYQEKLKTHSIKDISVPLATIVQTNVKQKCWKYEQEWRLLLECPQDYILEPFGPLSAKLKQIIPDYLERKFNYPIKCIKSVCLGMNFFEGVHSTITEYENEFVATNKLQNEILSFLASINTPTYILDPVGLSVEKRPIEILQIRQNAYRIIC